MQRLMIRFVFAFITTAILLGCERTDTPSKTPEQIQAEIEASQKRFAEERARIERENKAREEKLAYQRSLVLASFVSVDDARIVVELSNATGKPIDNLAGSLEVMDAEGNYVTSTGLTNWVPGDVYLLAGGTQTAVKTLDLMSAAEREKVIGEAAGYTYYYQVLRYQHVGGAEVDLRPDNMKQATTQSATPEPAAPVSPQEVAAPVSTATPCEAGQQKVSTTPEFYPGPKCEHVSRNLDSERFKVEYIDMCKANTGSPGVSVASVQIESCLPNPNAPGIVYVKQICCS